MLVLVNLMVLEIIVAPELGVASSHGVGGLQQVVAEIAVAGFDLFADLHAFPEHFASVRVCARLQADQLF